MAPDRPLITPATKVAELLEAYPELEETLIAQAPAFKRLKNPVLRRTVAKVASLEQAASVGGVTVRDLVATLRRAVGQEPDAPAGGKGDAPADPSSPPDWHAPRTSSTPCPAGRCAIASPWAPSSCWWTPTRWTRAP